LPAVRVETGHPVTRGSLPAPILSMGGPPGDLGVDLVDDGGVRLRQHHRRGRRLRGTRDGRRPTGGGRPPLTGDWKKVHAAHIRADPHFELNTLKVHRTKMKRLHGVGGEMNVDV